MSKIKLLPHQETVMEKTKNLNKVAFYLDMRWDLVKLTSDQRNSSSYMKP